MPQNLELYILMTKIKQIAVACTDDSILTQVLDSDGKLWGTWNNGTTWFPVPLPQQVPDGYVVVPNGYVVVCVDRTKGSDYLVFWQANRRGYTNDLSEADIFLLSEAQQICAVSRGSTKIKHVYFALKDLQQQTITTVYRDGCGFWEKVNRDV